MFLWKHVLFVHKNVDVYQSIDNGKIKHYHSTIQ